MTIYLTEEDALAVVIALWDASACSEGKGYAATARDYDRIREIIRQQLDKEAA